MLSPFCTQVELEKALELDAHNSVALYNLGLLFADAGPSSKTSISPSNSSTSSMSSGPSSPKSPSRLSSTDSGGGGSLNSSLKSSKDKEGPKMSYEQAAKYWNLLVDEVEPNHINGLRRLAKLEMEHLSNPKQADKRYVAALNALQSSIASSSPPPPPPPPLSTVTSPTSKRRAQKDKSSELDSLINEVILVMGPASARFDQSRMLAEKLRLKRV